MKQMMNKKESKRTFKGRVKANERKKNEMCNRNVKTKIAEAKRE